MQQVFLVMHADNMVQHELFEVWSIEEGAADRAAFLNDRDGDPMTDEAVDILP